MNHVLLSAIAGPYVASGISVLYYKCSTIILLQRLAFFSILFMAHPLDDGCQKSKEKYETCLIFYFKFSQTPCVRVCSSFNLRLKHQFHNLPEFPVLQGHPGICAENHFDLILAYLERNKLLKSAHFILTN